MCDKLYNMQEHLTTVLESPKDPWLFFSEKRGGFFCSHLFNSSTGIDLFTE